MRLGTTLVVSVMLLVGAAVPAVATPGGLFAGTVTGGSLTSGDGAPTDGPPIDESPTSTEQADDRFGVRLSSFVQETSAEADDAVADGMWRARFDRTQSRSAAERRTANLERRAATLQKRRQRLSEGRQNGSLSELKYAARLGQLQGELDALEGAVADVRPAAAAVGADVDRVDDLAETVHSERIQSTDVPTTTPDDTAKRGRSGPSQANARENGSNASDRTEAGDSDADHQSRQPDTDRRPDGKSERSAEDRSDIREQTANGQGRTDPSVNVAEDDDGDDGSDGANEDVATPEPSDLETEVDSTADGLSKTFTSE